MSITGLNNNRRMERVALGQPVAQARGNEVASGAGRSRRHQDRFEDTGKQLLSLLHNLETLIGQLAHRQVSTGDLFGGCVDECADAEGVESADDCCTDGVSDEGVEGSEDGDFCCDDGAAGVFDLSTYPKPRNQALRALSLGATSGGNPNAVLEPPAVDLAQGSANTAAVKRLQDSLVLLGHVKRNTIGNGFGNYGPITAGAVKGFQAAHSLPQTGTYDAATRAAMQQELVKYNQNIPQQPPLAAPAMDKSHPSPNQSSRNGVPIDTIVLHHTASNSVSSDLATLTDGNARNRVSAHYLIGRDGTIYNLVDDKQMAWHAGESSLYETQGFVNPRSIGIEITNAGDGTPFTEEQYKALEKLVPYLAQKYNVPVSNVVGHNDIALPPGRKSDPADNFDFARIQKSVFDLNTAPPQPRKDDILASAQQRFDEKAQQVRIGQPLDNGGGTDAHYWDGLVVRDYSGGIDSNNTKCTVVDGPSGPKAVRSDFYNHYLATENGKVNHIALGAPLDEEHSDGTNVVQNFEGGRMLWNALQGTRVQYLDQRPTQLPIADIVGEVYRRVLGRERNPGEGAEWEAFAQARRTEGRSDSQIRNLLAAEFHNSAEFNS